MGKKKKEHKIIDGILNKHCGLCGNWLSLDQFHQNKNTWDGKASQCISCVLEKLNKKCKQNDCEKNVVQGSEYCSVHNPETCSFDGCYEKTWENYDFCRLHEPTTKCKFEGCINRKRPNRKGFCRKHGPKIYCKYKKCKKVAYVKGLCKQHACKGNIKLCAQKLLDTAKRSDKTSGRECTLTVNDIIEMFNQNKKCYWCKHTLKLKMGGKFHLENISLDRKSNDIGHTKENTQLCCVFCNLARLRCKVKRWKNVMKILRGKKHTINFKKYKPRKTFFFYRFNHDSKPHDLTTKWYLDLVKKNDFKCMLTNLPLFMTSEKNFPWNCSIDRIDNTKDHTKDNCQLTCQFINLGKNRISNEKFKKWFHKRFAKINIKKIIYPKGFKEDFFKKRWG